jgi:undecaprenyl-phosphate 4-deoxy-4-formamido-L-arabinose transferase
MRISIVIPCYQSEQTLGPLVEAIFVAFAEPSTASVVSEFEVVLVVDGSTDGTANVANKLAAARPEVRAIELRRNYGQHNALLAGIMYAKHEVVVTMDDDLQHLPDQIPALLAPLARGEADLVYGVPREEEHGFWRSAASRTVKRGLVLAGVPKAGDVSAFRAFWTAQREGFTHIEDPYVSLDVMLSWTTTSISRVVVEMDRRLVGTSSYSLRALVRHSINMITGYSNIPLRVVAWLGGVCALIGAVLGAVVLWNFAAGDTTVAGFTTIAAMVAIFSGAQMLSLGIIGEYLGRLHTRSTGKPTFLVKTDSDKKIAPGREKALDLDRSVEKG